MGQAPGVQDPGLHHSASQTTRAAHTTSNQRRWNRHQALTNPPSPQVASSASLAILYPSLAPPDCDRPRQPPLEWTQWPEASIATHEDTALTKDSMLSWALRVLEMPHLRHLDIALHVPTGLLLLVRASLASPQETPRSGGEQHDDHQAERLDE